MKCVACNGKHFRKGYYDIDTEITIYPAVYNNVTHSLYDSERESVDGRIEVDTDLILDEIIARNDLEFRLYKEDNERYGINEYKKVYRYSCEDCGYIMNFTKEQNVESKQQEIERKKREKMYDWTNSNI